MQDTRYHLHDSGYRPQGERTSVVLDSGVLFEEVYFAACWITPRVLS